MVKKKKSVEEMVGDLAEMTARGFYDIEKTMATKEGLKDLEKRIDDRFDHMEFFMNTHERRIEMLEDRVRIISTKIGLRK